LTGEEQFRTVARRHVYQRLRSTEGVVDHWYVPDLDPDGLFRADLLIPGNAEPVATFFAASVETIDRSLVNARQFRHWDIDVHPVILHRLSSSGSQARAVSKASTVLGNDDVVRVDPSETFAYRRFDRRLEQLGVDLAT
jgi:hypothetical protein